MEHRKNKIIFVIQEVKVFFFPNEKEMLLRPQKIFIINDCFGQFPAASSKIWKELLGLKSKDNAKVA